MRPDKAIIPAAGRGTRLRPVTRWVPKELLPVGDTPALLHVLREALDAGIRDIALVISPDKPALDQFHKDVINSDDVTDQNIQCVYQPSPDGLADALRMGWNALNKPDQPVCSILPDNLYLGNHITPTEFLCEQVNGDEDHLSILHPIRSDQLDDYGYPGVPELTPLSEERYQLTSLPDKNDPSIERQSDKLYRLAGRSLLFPTFFDILKDIEDDLKSAGRELDDVPVVQTMIDRGKSVQCTCFEHRVHDIGHPGGLTAAWKALE